MFPLPFWHGLFGGISGERLFFDSFTGDEPLSEHTPDISPVAAPWTDTDDTGIVDLTYLRLSTFDGELPARHDIGLQTNFLIRSETLQDFQTIGRIYFRYATADAGFMYLEIDANEMIISLKSSNDGIIYQIDESVEIEDPTLEDGLYVISIDVTGNNIVSRVRNNGNTYVLSGTAHADFASQTGIALSAPNDNEVVFFNFLEVTI